MAQRDYTNGEVTVHWDSDLCIHCQLCWQGLPAVFDPNRRPWVDLKAATTQEIVSQVNQCPSKALSIVN
jgi:uncharacterized Fe-S cluster protein YjdI